MEKRGRLNMNGETYFFKKNIYVSFVLSILVLFIHANNLECFSDNVKFANAIETFVGGRIGDTIVPLFFIISGFLFYRNIDVFGKPLERICRKWETRLRSLIGPFFFWNLVGTIFYMLVPRIPIVGNMISAGAVSINLQNLVKGIFHYEYYFPLWYLFYLIILVFLAPIFSFLLKRKNISILLLVLTGIGYILDIKLPVLSCSSVFFYYSGAYFAVYFPCIFTKRERTFHAGSCLIAFVVIVLIRYFFIQSYISKVLYLTAPFVLWKGFDVFPFTKPAPRFVKQSFFIYCSHIIPLTIFDKLLVYILAPFEGNAVAIIAYLTSPAITIIVLWVGSSILAKYCHGFYAFISGGRG